MTPTLDQPEIEFNITLPELRSFLVEFTDSYHHLIILNAFRLFSRLNILEDVEETYLSLFMEADAESFDKQTLLSKVFEVALTHAKRIGRELGVTLNEDITDYRLIELLTAIVEIEDFEDSETLLGLLTEDPDRPALLADILALTDGQQAGEYLVDIYEVNPSLFDRILAAHISSLESTEETVDFVAMRSYRDRLKEFTTFLNTANLRVVNLIRAGMPYGLPMSVYQLRMRSIFTSLANANTAVEMFALTLICKDPYSNPATLTEPYIDKVALDPDAAASIRTTIHSLNRRFQPSVTAPQNITED